MLGSPSYSSPSSTSSGSVGRLPAARSGRSSLALTTVATLLSRLEKKGVLDHRRRGRAHVFRPTVTRSEVRRSMVRELAENLFEGKPSQLVSHLLLSTSLDPDEARYMRQALDEAVKRSQLAGPDGGASA